MLCDDERHLKLVRDAACSDTVGIDEMRVYEIEPELPVELMDEFPYSPMVGGPLEVTQRSARSGGETRMMYARARLNRNSWYRPKSREAGQPSVSWQRRAIRYRGDDFDLAEFRELKGQSLRPDTERRNRIVRV